MNLSRAFVLNPMLSKLVALLVASAFHPAAAGSTASTWQFTPAGVLQHDYKSFNLEEG